MSLRKEVFQAKVLQRLYPAAPKAEDVLDSPSPNPKAAAPLRRVQLKPKNTTGVAVECTLASRKVYTVLPPPDDYGPSGRDGSAAPAGMGRTTHKPAADRSGSDDQDGTEDEDAVRKRRRRRRKRKADIASEPGAAGVTRTLPQGGAEEESTVPESQGSEGPGRLSRNKKRKMKKKRHKEKLLSLGLVPRPRALDFTYTQNDEDEGAEDTDEESTQKLREILDFLRSTWDLYISDRSSAASRPFIAVDVAESLFAHMFVGTSPPTGLTCLCRLGALLGQRDAGQLNTALQEFRSTSTLTTDETAVVCTLLHYWISDVLPMQKECNR